MCLPVTSPGCELPWAAALTPQNDRLQGISDSLALLFGTQGRRGKGGHAWKTDGVAAELGAMGLRVKEMPSDGNCFCSSICDQIEVRHRYEPLYTPI